MTTLELRRKRAALVEQAREVLNTASTEKRDLTSEENSKYDRIMADVDGLKTQIEREERLSGLESEMRESIREPQRPAVEDRKAKNLAASEEYRDAFVAYLRGGMGELSSEQRSVLSEGFQRSAQSVGTGAAGGYTVPQGFESAIDKASKEFSSVEAVSSTMNTTSGNDIPWPTINDTTNSGRLITESTGATNTEVTFGSVTMKAYYFSSDSVLIPFELLQDSDIDLESLIGELLGERLGRIKNTYFTTGTGSSQPKGVVAESVLGVTAASATAITFNELLDLQHSVDPSYRKNARYMFADSTLKAIKKLADSQGRPLWLPGTAVKEPDTVNGYAYTINQDMSAIATGVKSVLFGDFSKYKVRNVKGTQLFRIAEKYIENRQVAYVAYMRADGRAVNAGTNPIKHLIQA